MNRIEHEDKDFIIAYKEHGVPTVPLKTQNADGTLLGYVADRYPEVLKVCGKQSWEGGAVHRLDTETAGLVVFARSQRFYDFIIKEQEKGRFLKTYTALTDGDFIKSGDVSTYFRAFGVGHKLVKAESDIKKSDNKVMYTTSITRLEKEKYRCVISNGFRHQIRVHLATGGCPIRGDKLYNTQSDEEVMQLECVGVSWQGFTYNLQ